MMYRTLLLISLGLTSMSASAQICNSANIQESTPSANFVTSIPLGRFPTLSPLLPDGSEILDLTTGLVWQRCSVGQNWNQTLSRCEGLPTKFSWSDALMLNSSGSWRIPNIKQLTSIIDFRCQAPPLNPEIFPDTPASMFYTLFGSSTVYGTGYWSSTPNLSPDNTGNTVKIGAWVMDLDLGTPKLVSVENNNPSISQQRHFVRLVRWQ